MTNFQLLRKAGAKVSRSTIKLRETESGVKIFWDNIQVPLIHQTLLHKDDSVSIRTVSPTSTKVNRNPPIFS
jgi:hypothetical protein